MKGFPDQSIPLVVTDPPYNCGKSYGKWKDNMPEKQYWKWYKEVFKEIYRVMAEGYCYVSSKANNSKDKQNFKVISMLEKIGFVFLQTIIWYRPNASKGGIRTLHWIPTHEPINFFQKGCPEFMLIPDRAFRILSHDVIVVASPQRNYKNGRFHITQKPLKLYKTLISRTPGDLVFDPFVGSGTSAVAALQLGRNFIGIDIEPKNVKLSRDRISGFTPKTLNKKNIELFNK